MASREPQTLSGDRVDKRFNAGPAKPDDSLTARENKDINFQNAASNNSLPVPNPFPGLSGPIQFRSTTIAPSPILATSHRNDDASGKVDSAISSTSGCLTRPPPTDAATTTSSLGLSSSSSSSSSSSTDDPDLDHYNPSPLGSGNRLRLQTNAAAFGSPRSRKNSFVNALSPGRPQGIARKSSAQSLRAGSRTPSVKAAIENSIGTASVASSTYPSPVISAMPDVTPLPSPLLSSDSPGPWRRLASNSSARPTSRDGLLPVPVMHDSVLISTNGESISAALANQAKRKVYAAIASEQGEAKPQSEVIHLATGAEGSLNTEQHSHQHGRNRSTSDYVPEPHQIPHRHTTVSGAHGKKPEIEQPVDTKMRREANLSEARGITATPTAMGKPPTPPPSESDSPSQRAVTKSKSECFEAYDRKDKKLRRWRAVKELGQGTFSKVMLATSQTHAAEEFDFESESQDGMLTPTMDSQLDRKTLVAIKICEHGPRGGASEDRIEMSLKRELDILRSINHPSLVNLKAWNIEPTRALLVLSYCPGGDLFDIASGYRHVLTPVLLRRIFSELVGAIRYLHGLRIVHRDIKLENVLVNLTPKELADSSINWLQYPYSVVTLADLGLSRRIADDEKLNTRCGSEDYAAPEVILGQPYDGRATDAWSLGVLLYALLETRLPFDPNPNMSDYHRMRSRTSHRIARVDWQWIKYVGDDGDHDANIPKFTKDGLLGAMEMTEELLKRARSRLTMDQVAEHDWVKGGIQVEAGLRFREEEEGEEVS
ncbi:hypothetical protein MKZ38_005294 [Zalerion maritima]|uniref:Protein kinase domain-containing protein n=1 Tax=Zalerion maritima TaxID=339359 RepID=A0AAD5RKK9_9PEZI|nr:hypothetical protein MKZ38_005294 [Zalerion maritima]